MKSQALSSSLLCHLQHVDFLPLFIGRPMIFWQPALIPSIKKRRGWGKKCLRAKPQMQIYGASPFFKTFPKALFSDLFSSHCWNYASVLSQDERISARERASWIDWANKYHCVWYTVVDKRHYSLYLIISCLTLDRPKKLTHLTELSLSVLKFISWRQKKPIITESIIKERLKSALAKMKWSLITEKN